MSIEGASKADIECTDNTDGRCCVTYLPTAPGLYVINILFADQPVQGTAHTCTQTDDKHNKCLSRFSITSHLLLPVHGSTGFFIRELFTQLSSILPDYFFSNHLLLLPHSKITFFNTYHRPSSSQFSKPFSSSSMNLFLSCLSQLPNLMNFS